jgi:hypothetical protein
MVMKESFILVLLFAVLILEHLAHLEACLIESIRLKSIQNPTRAVLMTISGTQRVATDYYDQLILASLRYGKHAATSNCAIKAHLLQIQENEQPTIPVGYHNRSPRNWLEHIAAKRVRSATSPTSLLRSARDQSFPVLL